MLDEWAAWLLLVGGAVGAAAMGVLLVRLPRQDDDVGPEEREAEAAWVADTIERAGGVAPVSLVEEVLDLHTAWLQLQRPPAPPSVAPPVPRGAVAGSPVSYPSGGVAPPLPPGYAPPGYAPPGYPQPGSLPPGPLPPPGPRRP